MKKILERVKRGDVIVGDGALGTMLIQRGLKSGECPEMFNLTKPEIVEEIARLYAEAGAEIITTNTFGASPVKLAHYGLEGKVEEINRQGVSLAKKGAARGIEMATRAVRIGTKSESADDERVSTQSIYIAGSCGSSGRILKPYGDAEPQQLYDSFARQMQVFVDAGVDIIIIETMTDLNETLLIVKAAHTVSSLVPIIATMTFDETPRGFYTIMGVSIKEAVANLEEAGVDIIGSNCGNGIEMMVRIAREFRKHSKLPLIIQANAGLPATRNGTIFYSETPEFFAEKTEELIDAGVSIVGGCCGTTPDHIRAIRRTIDSMSTK